MDRVSIGYAGRPKGLRGEVTVELLTWDPARFDDLECLRLERDGQPAVDLRVESWRQDRRGVLVKFDGVDSPEQVREQISGGYLTISREQVATPPAGRYFVFDVVGCQVHDESGRRLGEVTQVLEMPANDVFCVRLDAGGEVLVPAVRDFVTRVDVARQRIDVRGVEELTAAGE